jgi:hypothetical protein
MKRSLLVLLAGLSLTATSCKKSGSDSTSASGSVIAPGSPVEPTGKLKQDDYVLLELAQRKYYHNEQPLGPPSPEKHQDLVLKTANNAQEPGKALLALQALFIDHIVKQQQEDQAKNETAFRKLPKDVQHSILSVALEGFESGYNMDLDAMERATAKLNTNIDKMRLRMVREHEGNVILELRSATAANVAIQTYQPLLGTEDLSASHPFKIRNYLHDPVGFKHQGVWHRLEGRFVGLKYQGTKPLTNVLIATELKSKGASSALKGNQKVVDFFNRAVASQVNSDAAYERYLDANNNAARIQMAVNYHDTMPKAGYVFSRRINPGDELAVPLGSIEWDAYAGAELTILADQGQWPTHTLKLFKDSSAEEESCGMGASEAHVRDIHEKLKPLDLKDWPKPPAPDMKKLPKSTTFHRIAVGDDPLPTRIYGFADGKVVYNQWFTKEYIKAHIAGKDVKIGANFEDVKKFMYDKTGENGREIEPINWPVREKPDFRTFPKGIVFHYYGGNNDYFMFGHADGKVVYAKHLFNTGRGTGR